MNNDEMIRRCPNCDTINKGNVCSVCGEQLSPPNIKFDESVDKAPVKIVYKTKKAPIGSLVLINVILVVAVIVISIVISQNRIESYKNRFEAIQTMNHNAEMVYNAAYNYCIECNDYGNRMSDGEYVGQIGPTNELPNFLGTQDDFKSYISQMYSIDEPQFWAFYIEDGRPTVAYWSTEPLKGKTLNLSQDLIEDKNLMIGIYPQATVSGDHNSLSVNNKSDMSAVTTDAPVTDNVDNTELTEEGRFDYNLFEKELFNYVYESRINKGVSSVRLDPSLSEVAKKSLELRIGGTYHKDAIVQYVPTGYTNRGSVYELSFDLTLYKDEKAAAKAFFEYEMVANDGELWLKEGYTVCYAYAKENADGTSGIIVILMKN